LIYLHFREQKNDKNNNKTVLLNTRKAEHIYYNISAIDTIISPIYFNSVKV